MPEFQTPTVEAARAELLEYVKKNFSQNRKQRNFFDNVISIHAFPDIARMENIALRRGGVVSAKSKSYLLDGITVADIEGERNISFEGFESDPDIADCEQVIRKTFPSNIIGKCNIGEVQLHPNVVMLHFGKDETTGQTESYYLTNDEYQKLVTTMPAAKEYKVRAHSFVQWSAYIEGKQPILIYSFIDEDASDQQYLGDVPKEKQMRLFKLGTITHEIGHSLYKYLLDDVQRQEWQNIVGAIGHITQYAEKHAAGVHGNAINYDEEFAEAVRLKTTVPDYLKTIFSTVYNFLEKNFPEVGSI